MSTPSVAPPPPAKPDRFMQWHRRVLGVCLALIAFQLGLFLLIFPWSQQWGTNWIPVHSPRFAHWWLSPYFRGLVSGLGILNLIVAFAEAGRQLRQLFSRAD